MLSYKKHNRWAKQGGKVPNTNRTMLAPCLVHALPWAPFGSYPQDSPIWFTSSHVRGAMHLSHMRSKSNAYDWFIKCLWLVTWQDKVACHGSSLRLLWLRAPDNLASEDQTSGLRPGTAEFMHDLISRSVRPGTMEYGFCRRETYCGMMQSGHLQFCRYHFWIPLICYQARKS